jgi:hypothetical protein
MRRRRRRRRRFNVGRELVLNNLPASSSRAAYMERSVKVGCPVPLL